MNGIRIMDYKYRNVDEFLEMINLICSDETLVGKGSLNVIKAVLQISADVYTGRGIAYATFDLWRDNLIEYSDIVHFVRMAIFAQYKDSTLEDLVSI